jgi:cytidyltransferase-like protein
VNKQKSIKQLGNISKANKHKSKTFVMVHGCFDVFHIGHLEMFIESKKHGDLLVVGVLSDKLVRHYKGEGRPIFNFKLRAKIISHLDLVDFVYKLDTEIESEEQIDKDHDKIYLSINPNVVVSAKGDTESKYKKIRCERFNIKYVEVDTLINEKSTYLIERLGL